MAIYHCSIKIIGRSGGRSAVASSAYRSGEKLYNEETGIEVGRARKPAKIKEESTLSRAVPKTVPIENEEHRGLISDKYFIFFTL